MKKIILDCDPGHDDAVAIMLAAASDDIDLLGITCVGGNATLENTKLNALKICSLIGRTDIKIYAGAQSNPNRFGLGTTFTSTNQSISFGLLTHPVLPITHQINIGIIL